MRTERIGFAMCGSYCTHKDALAALRELCGVFENVTGILSENCACTDTRFGDASELINTVETLTGKPVILSIRDAEPVGPQKLLDALVIAPCTGTTLGKLAHGISDTAVAMAAKAHLRNDRPLILAIATNDGLGASAQNIGTLLTRRNHYFVPFGQDDAFLKPRSLIADFTKVIDTVDAALQGEQFQPLLLQ